MTDHKPLAGVFLTNPELILQHAISVALTTAAAVERTRRGGATLLTVCGDARMLQRAAALILRHVLQEMQGAGPIDERGFQRLVAQIAALPKES